MLLPSLSQLVSLTYRRLVILVALTLASVVVLVHVTLSPTSSSSLASPTSSVTSTDWDWDWSTSADVAEEGENERERVEGEGELGGGLYREFELRPWDEVHKERTGFREVEILGDECLESWLAQGIPCSPSTSDPAPPPPAFDVLWTWGNGSDPLWLPLIHHFLAITPFNPAPPAARHYRSNKDELRHSVRSVMDRMEPKPRRMHLVLGDWEAEEGEGRVGQMPGWLDCSKGVAKDGRVLGLEGETTEIFVHHHSEIFLRGSGGEEEQRNHTRDAVPTYNSFAIESNLHSIPNLSSVILYMQDDFFLLKKHTPADFSSPLLGPVLRLNSPKSYTIPAFRYPAPGCEHEWGSLLRSAWLLSERFAKKPRGHLVHVAKSLSHPMLLETDVIWSDEFDRASERRFRETQIPGVKTGDLNTSWLSTMLLIERARESMLFVWVVTRMGGAEGVWGKEQREELRRVLGLGEREMGVAENGTEVGRREKPAEEVVQVKQIRRETLDEDRMASAFEHAGMEGPSASKYYWSSLDGPLPGIGGRRKSSCELKMTTCFGPWWNDENGIFSAEEMFKRLAFGGDGSCGDCLLTALLTASGPTGLSALLPPADTPLYTLPTHHVSTPPTYSQTHDLQPHMPLTTDWRETSFSLPSLIGLTNPSSPSTPINLRSFALKLIARYQWVSTDSKALFSMIQAPADFGRLVEEVERESRKEVGLGGLVSLATNDDILEEWEGVLSPMVRAWYGVKFGVRGWWEREGI